MGKKSFIKTVLLTPATLIGALNVTHSAIVSDSNNLTGDTIVVQCDDLFENYNNATQSDVFSQEPFFASHKSIQRIRNSLVGRGHFKPYSVLKREMSKNNTINYSNFIISCALSFDDSENIQLLNCITNSGDNYKKPWFKSLLECLKNSKSPFLSFKANSLLKYHFGAE